MFPVRNLGGFYLLPYKRIKVYQKIKGKGKGRKVFWLKMWILVLQVSMCKTAQHQPKRVWCPAAGWSKENNVRFPWRGVWFGWVLPHPAIEPSLRAPGGWVHLVCKIVTVSPWTLISLHPESSQTNNHQFAVTLNTGLETWRFPKMASHSKKGAQGCFTVSWADHKKIELGCILLTLEKVNAWPNTVYCKKKKKHLTWGNPPKTQIIFWRADPL